MSVVTVRFFSLMVALLVIGSCGNMVSFTIPASVTLPVISLQPGGDRFNAIFRWNLLELIGDSPSRDNHSSGTGGVSAVRSDEDEDERDWRLSWSLSRSIRNLALRRDDLARHSVMAGRLGLRLYCDSTGGFGGYGVGAGGERLSVVIQEKVDYSHISDFQVNQLSQHNAEERLAEALAYQASLRLRVFFADGDQRCG